MIGLLTIIFGTTMLYASLSTRLESYIKAISAQGFFLFLLVITNSAHTDMLTLIILCIETIGIKTTLIPIFLHRLILRNNIQREEEPDIPMFYSLVISSLIFAFGFYVAYWATAHTIDLNPLFFGISVSTMMMGLFIIVTRKKIITHVMGYMMLENGIFLLSLSLTYHMPIIVNLGVLLDVFIAIYLLGLFVTKIQSTFQDVKVQTLTRLKD